MIHHLAYALMRTAHVFLCMSNVDVIPCCGRQVKMFMGRFQHPNFYIQLPLQVAAEREAFRLMYDESQQVGPGLPLRQQQS